MLSRLGLRPSAELLVAEVIDRLETKHSTWGRAEVVEALTVVVPTRRIDSADNLRPHRGGVRRARTLLMP
jgi:hypothetical protein